MSFVGTAVENYSLILAALAAGAVWPSIFFPNVNPLSALVLSVSTFLVGMLSQPLGAFAFGHYGDTRGRLFALVFTLVTSGIGAVGIALTPGYVQIGIFGGVLIVIFRFLHGFGFGGEWGGASTWITEQASKSKWRAFWGSWVGQGQIIGAVVASATFVTLLGILGHAQFFAIGWRICFMLGAAGLIIAAIARYSFSETEIFMSMVARKKTLRMPAVRVLKEQWRLVLLLSLTAMSTSAAFFVLTTFASGYLAILGAPSAPLILGIVIAGIIAIFEVIGFMIIADKVGRKLVMLAGALAPALMAFPFFILLNTKSSLFITIGVILLLLTTTVNTALATTWFSELFPSVYRFSGVGLSHSIGIFLGGGLAPLIAAALISSAGGAIQGWPYVSLMIVVYCAISLLAIMFCPETKGIEMER
ncbi:MAG: MFS transporter [Nitrososphaerales archaeon]|nr:MFS transporter [Nitrososphaerales archaeon]